MKTFSRNPRVRRAAVCFLVARHFSLWSFWEANHQDHRLANSAPRNNANTVHVAPAWIQLIAK